MEKMQLFEQIAQILAVLGGGAALVKTLTELSTGWTMRARGEYDLVNTVAQQSGDTLLGSYAEELALKIIVGDPNLSTAQRRALLTLPNRSRSIPRYLKSRRLLCVQPSGQVLRWKLQRHKSRWYRKSLMGTLYFLYVALSLAGVPALFGPYPPTFSLLLDAVLRFPQLVSMYFVFLAGWSLSHALTISTAESLVEEVEAVGPFVG